MSKKDYENFAAMYKGVLAEIDGELFQRMLWETIVNETADLFKRDNPRFDRQRFLLACGKDW